MSTAGATPEVDTRIKDALRDQTEDNARATPPVLELEPGAVISSPDEDLHDLHRRRAAVVEAVSGAFLEEVGVPRADLHGPSSVQV